MSSESEKEQEPPAKKRMTSLHYTEMERENADRFGETSTNAIQPKYSQPASGLPSQEQKYNETQGVVVKDKEGAIEAIQTEANTQGSNIEKDEDSSIPSRDKTHELLTAERKHGDSTRDDAGSQDFSNQNEKIADGSKHVNKTQTNTSDVIMRDSSDVVTTDKLHGTGLVSERLPITVKTSEAAKDEKPIGDAPKSEGLIPPKEKSDKAIEVKDDVTLEVPSGLPQAEDVVMREEKPELSETEKGVTKTQNVMKDKPVPMDIEESEVLKKTTDVADGKELVTKEIAEEKSKSIDSVVPDTAMEQPKSELALSASSTTTTSGMAKADFPLIIKQDQVHSDETLALTKIVSGIAEEKQARDSDNDKATKVGQVITATGIANNEKPLTSSQSTEKKEESDVAMETTREISQTASNDKGFAVPTDPQKIETSQTDANKPLGSSKTDEPQTESSIPLTELEKQAHRDLIDVCIHGLEHCLLRFPQHHKSRYRLAYVNYVSPYHKVSHCVLTNTPFHHTIM